MTKPTQFIVNDQGEQVAVILSVEEYREILAVLEDLDDVRAYDESKAAIEEAVPLEQALEEIRRDRTCATK
jgi:PHD/YefM family antitoxin component YafN of YafNO toxin-antitoxin module